MEVRGFEPLRTCCADDPSDPKRSAGIGGLRLFVLVCGSVAVASFGFLIVVRADDARSAAGEVRGEIAVWASLIGAVLAYAAVGGAFALRWLRDSIPLLQLPTSSAGGSSERLKGAGWVQSMKRLRRHPYTAWFLAVVGIMVAVFLALWAAGHSMRLSGERTFGWQIDLVTGISVLAVIPALMGLLADRWIADTVGCWQEEPTCRVALHRRLGRDMRRRLFLLGGFLTLVVVATGARRRVILELQPTAVFPSELVFLYGLVFATVLGGTFWAADAARSRRTEQLVREYGPLPAPDVSDERLTAELSRHDGIRRLFTAGDSTWTALQAGIVVLGPLITGLIGSLLPES